MRMGCVADSSNHVTERIELEVKEVKKLEEVRVWPNPTTGELRIEVAGQARNDVQSVEVFDIYGRKVYEDSNFYGLTVLRSYGLTTDGVVIDISHLHAGIYFVKITTEQAIITKKVIKN